MSVSNDATGNTVTDNGAGGPRGPRGAEQSLTAQGRIKAQLHGPRGELNGVLLEDGTIVRLPPPEAQRLRPSSRRARRSTCRATGSPGRSARVIAAQSIGPSATQLAQVAAPPPRRAPATARPPPPGGPGAPPPRALPERLPMSARDDDRMRCRARSVA